MATKTILPDLDEEVPTPTTTTMTSDTATAVTSTTTTSTAVATVPTTNTKVRRASPTSVHNRAATTTTISKTTSKMKQRTNRERADTRVVIVDKDKQNYCLPETPSYKIPYDNVGLHQPRRHYQHETAVVFESKPRRVLIVKKHHNEDISRQMRDMVDWLQSKHVDVFIEQSVQQEFKELQTVSLEDPGEGIDFMVCLGGDGTLLHLMSLFQAAKTVPPVMVFASGSLGFLTPYEFTNYRTHLSQILKPNTTHFVTFRLRLEGKIYRFNSSKQTDITTNTTTTITSDIPTLTQSTTTTTTTTTTITATATLTTSRSLHSSRFDKDSPILPPLSNPESSIHGRPSWLDESLSPLSSAETMRIGPDERSLKFVRRISIAGMESDQKFEFVEMGNERYTVLNEVVITRGPHASLITVQLFVDGEHVTTVNADGLIIATPTGSTAYSVSAGGSLVSPMVPSICITPICPHTLSFRPVIVPDTSIIQVRVPHEARHVPIAQFDGSNTVQLNRGDVVEIVGSEFPLPTFKQHAFGTEWFSQLRSKFNWNIREEQKPM